MEKCPLEVKLLKAEKKLRLNKLVGGSEYFHKCWDVSAGFVWNHNSLSSKLEEFFQEVCEAAGPGDGQWRGHADMDQLEEGSLYTGRHCLVHQGGV